MKKLLLLLSIVCFGKVNAQLCFMPAITDSAGTHPSSVISNDFNGDSNIDLAVANYTSNNVSILLGNGTGNFGGATNFLTGSNPISVSNADFNGDSKVDLVVANFNSGDVSVLLGVGTGSFSSATNFAVGNTPSAVICSDVNGDSKMDLVVSNYGNYFSVLLGTGNGSFGTATNFTVPGYNSRSIISADFNGDSKVDLAIAGDTSCVVLGTGTGNFGSPTKIIAGMAPISVTAADFNGDGFIDLAIANDNSNDVSVFLGTGTGAFGNAINITGAGLYNPNAVTNADFNNDGKIDLAVTFASSNRASVFLGSGTGSFVTPSNYTTDSNPFSIASGDFNGDSKIDLAVGNYHDNDVQVFLNCTAVGIANISDVQQIKNYPNPASDQFYIETNATDKISVDLFDVNGRHVYSASVNDKENINIATLDNGIYTIVIKTSDHVINKKLVIVR